MRASGDTEHIWCPHCNKSIPRSTFFDHRNKYCKDETRQGVLRETWRDENGVCLAQTLPF